MFKKLQVVALEFIDYTLLWCDGTVKQSRRYEESTINTRKEMKRIMRVNFFPSHYHMNLHNKLQRLPQGSQIVGGYYKEMEVAKIRANAEEDKEVTMTRFLHCLN